MSASKRDFGPPQRRPHSTNGALPNTMTDVDPHRPDPSMLEMNGSKLKTSTELIRAHDPPPVESPKKVAGFRSLFTYPRGTYFCLGNEFSERFSFYGMKAILIIYLKNVHGLSPSISKLVYHAFVFTAYFCPIFGSIIADGFFGRYRVILFGSIIYCVGHALLTLSAVPAIGMAAMKALDYTGLLVIALATGGIKPCVSAFAADQFPQSMSAERLQFFSFFYFMINLGALMSQVITPILRHQPCLGNETCFPLAFGVPAIFMFIATIIFCIGTPFYKISKVRDNVIWRVCQCIFYAIKQKFRSKQKKVHWLDHALPKYDKELVDDVKALINVMLLFIPVVVFWALFEQQGSTWVLQGEQMNGRIGRLTILPDQMGVLNPLFVIILIPLFEGVIYPVLARCNAWTRMLRRMGWGGFLAALSFIAAGLLQFAVNKTAVPIPAAGHARLSATSFLKCNVLLADGHTGNITVSPGTSKEVDLMPSVTLSAEDPSNCGANWPSQVTVPPVKPGSGHFLALFESNPSHPVVIQYPLAKTPDGKTRIHVLFEPAGSTNLTVSIRQDGLSEEHISSEDPENKTYAAVAPGLLGSDKFDIYLTQCPDHINCTRPLLSFNAQTGAAYFLVIPAQDPVAGVRMVQVIAPNTISILWQVPQYVIITVGEILFSISGLAFSYTQASPKMKSVFQAVWLLTSAFGQVIDMGLSGSGAFEGKPEIEFFVYGASMGGVMILFVILAWRYKSTREEA